MHVHSAPDVVPRLLDDIELVDQARKAGMRALVLKNHHCSTCSRAYLLNRIQGEVRLYGGVVLNDSVGGLNPWAVEAAIKMGGEAIWMPTVSAANHRRFFGGRGGLTILKGTRLRPQVTEILRLISDANKILATGHLSPAESAPLIEAALSAGVRRISVTHPEWGVTAMPVKMQRKFAKSGVVFFERCLISAQAKALHTVPFETIVQQMRAVGVASTIIATDFGLPNTMAPVEAFRFYLARLRKAGFSHDEIKKMAHENPARLLGLTQ